MSRQTASCWAQPWDAMKRWGLTGMMVNV
jgi:hypothetical protein